MRSQFKLLQIFLCLLLFHGSCAFAQNQPENATGSFMDPPASQVAILFDAEARAEDRRSALLKFEALAQEKNAPRIQFMLGTLYRWGMEHPAKLVEEDRAKAIELLSQASRGGDLSAMATLAELYLENGDAESAMVWAALHRHYQTPLDKKQSTDARPSPDIYAIDLILRCKARLHKSIDDEMILAEANRYVAANDSNIRFGLQALKNYSAQDPKMSANRNYDTPEQPRDGVARGGFLLGINREGKIVKQLTVGLWPNLSASRYMADFSLGLKAEPDAEAPELRWIYTRYTARKR